MNRKRRSELKEGTVFKYLKNDGTRIPHNQYVWFAEKRSMFQPTMVGGEHPKKDSIALMSDAGNRWVEVLWEPRS